MRLREWEGLFRGEASLLEQKTEQNSTRNGAESTRTVNYLLLGDGLECLTTTPSICSTLHTHTHTYRVSG